MNADTNIPRFSFISVHLIKLQDIWKRFDICTEHIAAIAVTSQAVSQYMYMSSLLHGRRCTFCGITLYSAVDNFTLLTYSIYIHIRL